MTEQLIYLFTGVAVGAGMVWLFVTIPQLFEEGPQEAADYQERNIEQPSNNNPKSIWED